ncbi:VOC family protein [Sphingomonas solaris]|uniref:VOC family protein n=1 Tax=Alterirhizorhabdus solaris TaxID=2529389 RepID=A0A558RBA9_9SPHN|nr:VOC family protein [Sphingomonas solaris]TVV76552.1 VOC family protein [Sphingomonas solaris]
MTLLKCATHVVSDVAAAVARYARELDYVVVEQSRLTEDLAASWAAPASAGRAFAVMQPASGTPVFLRFVEGDPVPGYRPIRTTGWAATEICVQDVEIVNERMIASENFEVIGPPKPLDGFPTVKPMQVRGPDQEIVYLTEIRTDDPESGLPVPASLVDRPFILVLACPDLAATIAWTRDVLGLDVTEPVSIRYSMIQLAFGLDAGEKTPLCIVRWKGQTFLELDQYPAEVTPRAAHPGALPPGVAIVTMMHPDFARLDGHWASPPVVRDGALYSGRRTGVLKTPEGALLEIIEGEPVA